MYFNVRVLYCTDSEINVPFVNELEIFIEQEGCNLWRLIGCQVKLGAFRYGQRSPNNHRNLTFR